MKMKLFYISLLFALIAQIYFALNGPVSDQIDGIHLKLIAFDKLPNWTSVNKKQSLTAFKTSCRVFLKTNPNRSVGSQFIPLKAKDWYPACNAAMAIDLRSAHEIKKFFETWFQPAEIKILWPVRGLFTGYYLPLLHGSLTKTERYHIPIYSLPNNLVSARLALFNPKFGHQSIHGQVKKNQLIPYFTREQIDHGAINKFASVLVWVDTQLERLKLEIEGSGVVELTNGERIVLGYAGENGAPYRSIASILIKKKILTPDTASMKRIQAYLDNHPNETDTLFYQNPSFVFFSKRSNGQAIGSQGVKLTPGYSLAVDLKWIPIGMPLWLSTSQFNPIDQTRQPFHRLMIAQDTGGAIRGPVRGDIFWGAGEKATQIANQMKSKGRYWLLLPKSA